MTEYGGESGGGESSDDAAGSHAGTESDANDANDADDPGPRLRRAATADEPLLGGWLSVPHPMVAELLAGSGFDFLCVDAEHAPVSFETMANLLRAVDAAPGGTETLVRVGGHDPVELKRTMDLDPDALLVPMVDTAEEAEAIVDATRYPPAGSRGVGLGRATDYGRDLDGYVASADDRFARFVQIESEEAVENVADIAAVDGVDGVFVGPVDLSTSMGLLGAWDDERFQDAVDRVLSVADDEGVAVGTLATDAESRRTRLAEWGVDYLAAGVDATYLEEGARRTLSECADALKER
ncbi:HpcH/HpaI aldolase/citrate lyase family protein [Halobium salinum]|uniref:HpcH/HpaI aldolase/citrate lyase family protein n=1 Tax=Halobium salinum TaxID=1364940 RepID=A0ABD5PHP6_9EURY|nr:aldolase/citrate lyase family protein [Halobium salinum]